MFKIVNVAVLFFPLLSPSIHPLSLLNLSPLISTLMLLSLTFFQCSHFFFPLSAASLWVPFDSSSLPFRIAQRTGLDQFPCFCWPPCCSSTSLFSSSSQRQNPPPVHHVHHIFYPIHAREVPPSPVVMLTLAQCQSPPAALPIAPPLAIPPLAIAIVAICRLLHHEGWGHQHQRTGLAGLLRGVYPGQCLGHPERERQAEEVEASRVPNLHTGRDSHTQHGHPDHHVLCHPTAPPALQLRVERRPLQGLCLHLLHSHSGHLLLRHIAFLPPHVDGSVACQLQVGQNLLGQIYVSIACIKVV